MKLLGTVDGLTYYLWYFKKPTTELDEDDDTILIPDRYCEAPVYYAAAELLDEIGKTELSDRYWARYNSYVDKAIIEFERHHLTKEKPVPDLGDIENRSEVDRQGKGYQY